MRGYILPIATLVIAVACGGRDELSRVPDDAGAPDVSTLLAWSDLQFGCGTLRGCVGYGN